MGARCNAENVCIYRPQIEKKIFERGLKLKDLIYKTTFRKEIFQNFLSGDPKSPPKFEN